MNSDAMRQLNMVRFMDWDIQPAAFNVLKNTGIRSTNMAGLFALELFSI